MGTFVLWSLSSDGTEHDEILPMLPMSLSVHKALRCDTDVSAGEVCGSQEFHMRGWVVIALGSLSCDTLG